MLTIDGGGVKGIVPLQGLQLLELMLEPLLPRFPIQDHFRVSASGYSGNMSGVYRVLATPWGLVTLGGCRGRRG